jgi:nucleotide-binding universal stress UspA family protein
MNNTIQQYRDLDKILVPVPLNSDFAVPLRQALHFQEVYGGEIILLNVVSRYSIFHRVLNPDKLKRQQKKAKRKLKKMITKYFGGEIPHGISLKIVTGTLLSAIMKTASELDCDLIIIKKAKRISSRFSYLKTENADKLIAEAVCPVFTIMSDPTPQEISNIMVPVEIFKNNTNKVEWAISLARKFKARLHLVSVLDADIKVKNSLSYKKIREIEKLFRSEGIDVTKEILKTPGEVPGQAILDYAAELKPEMLLIMARKESVIRDNYLGAFTRTIIHHASVPVFSVVPSNETPSYDIMKPVPERIRRKHNQTVK